MESSSIIKVLHSFKHAKKIKALLIVSGLSRVSLFKN
jgi:hypothetical protein